MFRFLLTFAATLAAGAALAAPPRVVADIAPVQSLVARVMAGVGEADVILPPGASPHDHALRPSEARSLSDADLVIWVGPVLTGWLDDAVATLAPQAAQLVLADVSGVRVLPFREGGAFAGHDDHEGHAEEEAFDPHLWLDPANGMAWLAAIAGALGEMDPANAALYRANAEAGAEEIRSGAARIASLMGAAPRPYLAYHDAFGYAEGWLGLEGVGAIQSGHAVDPGPAQLAGLRDTLAAAGVSCVLAEPQFNAGLVAAVMGEGEAKIVTIDPLGSAFEPGPGQYLEILGQFAQVAEICN